jgi:hypothetical protein
MMNSRQLNRWLMQEVHGETVGLERKPPRRATSSLGNKPARNWKYRAWIRSLPCASCGIEPAGEAAHTGSRWRHAPGGLGLLLRSPVQTATPRLRTPITGGRKNGFRGLPQCPAGRYR